MEGTSPAWAGVSLTNQLGQTPFVERLDTGVSLGSTVQKIKQLPLMCQSMPPLPSYELSRCSPKIKIFHAVIGAQIMDVKTKNRHAMPPKAYLRVDSIASLLNRTAAGNIRMIMPGAMRRVSQGSAVLSIAASAKNVPPKITAGPAIARRKNADVAPIARVIADACDRELVGS